MMRQIVLGFCFLLLLRYGVSPRIAAAQTPVPDHVARKIASHLAAHFDPIETIQIRFSTSVHFLLRPSDNPDFDDYELKQAFYAYDVRASRQFLDCIDTRKGPSARKRAARGPGLYQELVETQDASPRGAVADPGHRSLTWEGQGPQSFLQMLSLGRCRKNLEQGNCRVYYSAGPGSDPQVWVSIAPKPIDEMVEEFYFRFTLDAQRGLAPVSIDQYLSGKLVRRTTLEPFEVQPGIWLPKRGLMSNRLITEDGIESDKEFVRTTFQMEKDSVRINQPIPASQFEIDFPPGTRVADVLQMRNYTVGLKPGQATRQAVLAGAEHARHIAPVNTEQQGEIDAMPTRAVRAEYRTPWYGRVWLWTLAGSVLAVAVAACLFVLRKC